MKYLDREPDAAIFSPRDAVGIRRGRRQNAGHDAKPRPKKGKRRVGEFYTKDSFRKAVERACNAAGVQRWHPHQVRHTKGTEVRERYGLDGAQVILGHARVSTTQVYARVNEQLGEKIAAEIG
jgi:integrase